MSTGKFVHELSRQLGLKSKSYGKGEERKVVVSKVLAGGGLVGSGMMGSMDTSNANDKKKRGGGENCDGPSLPTEEEYKQVPRVKVGKRGEDALVKHLSRFPPSVKEEAESRETGSSLLLMKNNERDAGEAAATLDDDAVGDSSNDIQQQEELLTLDDILAPAGDSQLSSTSATQHRSDQQQRQRHERMIQHRVQNHKLALQQMQSHPQYKQMMKQRRNLPAFAYAQDICNVLRSKRSQVTILTGDTGCGYVITIKVCDVKHWLRALRLP